MRKQYRRVTVPTEWLLNAINRQTGSMAQSQEARYALARLGHRVLGQANIPAENYVVVVGDPTDRESLRLYHPEQNPSHEQTVAVYFTDDPQWRRIVVRCHGGTLKWKYGSSVALFDREEVR